MTWFAVGAAVVGTVGSVVSSNKAAKGQQDAANQAEALSRDQYQQTRQDNMPALEARNNALQQMQDLASKYGGGVPSAQAVMGAPGYQFGLQQGNANIQNSAAAAGGLYSGAVGKALAKYGTDYATTKYNDAFNQMQTAQTNDFNRYASISGQGQTGANQIATSGQNMANQVGQIGMSNANAQGAAGIAQGNAIQNGLNQGVSAWNNSGSGWFGGGQGMGNIDYGAPSYNNAVYSQAGGYADGGPVRREPVVGSRSPVRTSGAGPMSMNAIAAMLAEKPEAPDRINTLNQRAVTSERLKKADEYARGGAIKGPGGPRDDNIPIMASNDEFVLSVPTVKAIGGGSIAAGHAKLNKLQAMVKGKKHA